MRGIPKSLKQKQIWFLWVRRHINAAGNSEETVEYFSPISRKKLAVTNPRLLSDYDTMAREREADSLVDGGGIYVADDLAVLVLRNCFTSDGALRPWAVTIVSQIGTYWERTPDGLSAQCVLLTEQQPPRSGSFYYKQQVVQLLVGGEWCRLSEDTLPESADDVKLCQAALNWLVSEISAEPLGFMEQQASSASTQKTEPNPQDQEASSAPRSDGVPVRVSDSEGFGSSERGGNAEGRGAEAEEQPSGDLERPSIVVNTRQFRDILFQAQAALLQANRPPVLFDHQGQVARVIETADGSAEIRSLRATDLTTYLSIAADIFRLTAAGDLQPVIPPREIASGLLTFAPWQMGFPLISGILTVPTPRSDGSLITEPGYDHKTAMYYKPAIDIVGIKVREDPSRQDITRSRELLYEAIADFRFVDAASRANFLAALLTPALMLVIAGKIPMFTVRAPQPGSGKTTLQNTIGIVYEGVAFVLDRAPRAFSDEWEKKVFAILRTGARFVLFDNVEHQLESEFLAQAITSERIRSRILGVSVVRTVSSRVFFLANGNSLLTTGQNMKRRCFWSVLEGFDARVGRRGEDQGWRHEPYLAWVKQNRSEILAAILTLVRAWFSAGCPNAGRIIDSFEDWSRVVGGVLACAEIPDFLVNYDQMLQEVDPAETEWEAFLRAVRLVLDADNFTTRTLMVQIEQIVTLQEVLPDDLREPFFKKHTNAFGRVLLTIVGRRFGESRIRLERVGLNRDKVAVWRVVLEQ